MDTETIRLVIFIGMFLVFAGDYTLIMSTIFGKNGQKNVTTSLKRPQNPIKESNIGDTVSKTLSDEKKFFYDGDDTEDRAKRIAAKAKLISTIKSACLPKLICELTASTNQEQLSDTERSLLNLIRDTSLSTTAEVASRYHFAAHMGQLISGLEGQGCHNFYPTCPFPGTSVLSMMKQVRLR